MSGKMKLKIGTNPVLVDWYNFFLSSSCITPTLNPSSHMIYLNCNPSPLMAKI